MIRAISPLDGRYADKVAILANYFSEFALVRYRIHVEVEWFLYMMETLPEMPVVPESTSRSLRDLVNTFSDADATRVKEIESTTNHDVKAVEYFIKEKLSGSDIESHAEFIHFGCTSEDINNLAYALMCRDYLQDVFQPTATRVTDLLASLAADWVDVPMLSRTHGQTASPTTVGKELVNVLSRLDRLNQRIRMIEMLGKINGAVGNFNAHTSAYPDLNWPVIAEQFVTTRLKLAYNPLTIQIEPHDAIAELADAVAHWNTVLIDLDRDIWGYISLGFFKQKLKAGEIGSSTMPHKVNPIDFENSEGNAGMANALLRFFSEKLPISRWQRDLTDSTVLRNLGVAFGYSQLSMVSLLNGMGKLEIHPQRLAADLDAAWEVLAEPIQTVMRANRIPEAYEKLKELTRGQVINAESIRTFINQLNLPQIEKDRLLQLSPPTYIGNASDLARDYLRNRIGK